MGNITIEEINEIEQLLLDGTSIHGIMFCLCSVRDLSTTVQERVVKLLGKIPGGTPLTELEFNLLNECRTHSEFRGIAGGIWVRRDMACPSDWQQQLMESGAYDSIMAKIRLYKTMEMIAYEYDR